MFSEFPIIFEYQFVFQTRVIIKANKKNSISVEMFDSIYENSEINFKFFAPIYGLKQVVFGLFFLQFILTFLGLRYSSGFDWTC